MEEKREEGKERAVWCLALTPHMVSFVNLGAICSVGAFSEEKQINHSPWHSVKSSVLLRG